ncbi:MAG: Ig-like domain-containing protein [Bacteroidota bacterium]
MKRLSLVFLQTAFLLFILATPRLMKAEGTKDLMPDPSQTQCVSYVQGNDERGGEGGKEGPTFGDPADRWIYVHIDDPTTETIYYGFNKLEPLGEALYYIILAPNGDTLCRGQVAEGVGDPGYIPDDGVAAYTGPKQIAGATSNGYQALECTPTIPGDYAILFNVGNPHTPANLTTRYYVHPFDVTVADVSNPINFEPVQGRLFSYRWTLNTNSGSNESCATFYTWTLDSIVVAFDMNNMQPYGYTVSFNSYGVQNTGDIVADRKSNNNPQSDVEEFRVFLNDPDPNVWPSGNPGTLSVTAVNGCETALDFCIEVNVNKGSQVNVYLDLDGNGAYDPGGVDVFFPFNQTNVGIVCIPWDGLDGLGNPVASGAVGTVQVEYFAGLSHYPLWDGEAHVNGFNAQVVRPAGTPQPLMYFDNSNIPLGTVNLTGCSSGCNTWNANDGDGYMINTWIAIPMDTAEAQFVVGSVCPPSVENDTGCVVVNSNVALILPVLDNDSDPENNIDTASVTVFGLDPAHGTATVDLSNGQISFLPANGFSGQATFQYQVCDESIGSPLCRNAVVYVDVSSNCDNTSVFPVEWSYVEVEQDGVDGVLYWATHREVNTDYFEIQRSLDGHIYQGIGEQAAAGYSEDVETYSFRDEDILLKATSKVYYRIKQSDLDGRYSYSDKVVLTMESLQNLPLKLRVYPNPTETMVNIAVSAQARFRLVSTSGQEVMNLDLTDEVTSISLAGLAPGIYFIEVNDGEKQAYSKLVLQPK